MKYEITRHSSCPIKSWRGGPGAPYGDRIRALRDIPSIGVKKGDYGGYVETERNLSQEGNCWIEEGGYALGKSKVMGNALLKHGAYITNRVVVKDDATIEDVWLSDEMEIGGDTIVASDPVIIKYGECLILVSENKIIINGRPFSVKEFKEGKPLFNHKIEAAAVAAMAVKYCSDAQYKYDKRGHKVLSTRTSNITRQAVYGSPPPSPG